MRLVNSARTVWEQGREPGHQVVALGAALALTAVALDLSLLGRLTVLFDVGFVAVCVVLALAVRPADFFVVGVLPPLIMLGVLVLLGVGHPEVIARPHDGAVQAVVSGLTHHSGALVTGYLLCLACLVVRQRRMARRP